MKAGLIGLGLLIASLGPGAISANAANGPQHIVIVNPVNGTCSPDVITVKQSHGRGVQIMFKIDPRAGPKWRWSQSPHPIVVDAPEGVFSGGVNPGGNGKGPVLVFDRNLPSDVGTYKYTAALIEEGASEPVIIDPSIVNEL